MIIKLLLIGLILIGTPILSFIMGHILQRVVPESKYKNKFQIKNKGLVSLFVLTFCFICLYRTTNLPIWALVLNIPFVWVGFSNKQPFLPEKGMLKLQRYQLLWLVTFASVALMFLLCLKPVYKINWNDSVAIENNRISMLYLLVLAWVMVYLIVTFFTNNKVNGIILSVSCLTWVLVLIMKILWRYTYANSVRIGITSLFSDQVILLTQTSHIKMCLCTLKIQ